MTQGRDAAAVVAAPARRTFALPRVTSRTAAAATGVSLVAICAFAIGYDLVYARRGFMPLDQGIVWDGGWRILSGEVPFRDFITPTGVSTAVVQALFFELFGVNWVAFCLHGAVLNALFCLLVYVLLRRVAVSRPLSLAAAAATAVVYYPPIGTGYTDQDASFFLLAAVVATTVAVCTGRRRLRAALLVSAPALVLAATLSKQLPGVFGVPVVLAVVLAADRRVWRPALLWLAAGVVAVVVVVDILLAVLGVDLGLARISLIDLPRTVGADRRHTLAKPSTYLHSAGLWSAWLAYGLLVITGVLAIRCRRLGDQVLRLRLTLAFWLFTTCLISTALTANEPQNGMPFVPLVVVLLWVSLRELLPDVPRRTWVLAAAGVVLAAVAVRDLVWFDRHVNATRLVQNMKYHAPSAAEQQGMPKALRFMRFQLPTYGPQYYKPADLGATAADLAAHPGNFMFVGDTNVLYALADRPSTFPSLFLDPDQGFPTVHHPDYPRFERLLQRNLVHWHVRRIVIEGGKTWTGVSFDDFPSLKAYATANTCSERSYGEFLILELCRPAGT